MHVVAWFWHVHNFKMLRLLHASTTYMCSHVPSTLLSSNAVSAAAEWDWSEGLPGMGCKYKIFELLIMT